VLRDLSHSLRSKYGEVKILRFAQDDNVWGVPEMQECDSVPLTQIGDFFVEVGEGGFEGLAMVGMSGGSEIVHDADTR
jgi:hypothetical protein